MEAAQQVSVVTGGSGGLGLAIARYLAKRGDRIVLWDLDRHVAEKAAEFEGGLGLIVDVTDQASVARGFEETIERASGIANLINSAGITGPNFSAVVLRTMASTLRISSSVRPEYALANGTNVRSVPGGPSHTAKV